MAHPSAAGERLALPLDQQLERTLKASHLSGLDALRALAITLVLVDHYLVLDHLFHLHRGVGSMGVMIFFVLSGFLITRILLYEYAKTGKISLSNFYRRRSFRIFPAFYCCWSLTTMVNLLFHQFHWQGAAASFFYLMDYGRGIHGGIPEYSQMWISWSLAIEEKFYLLWPLFLVALFKRRFNPLRAVSSLILVLWVYRTVLYLGLGVAWNYLYCAFEARADALLAGCLLALLVDNPKTRAICSRLLQWQWLVFVPPLLLGYLALSPPANHVLFLASWTLQPLIVAVMLLQAVYFGERSWTFCRFRMVKVVALLSYSLYLYHPLASEIIYLLHIPHNGLVSAVLFPVLAVSSYLFVERPFLRMRDRPRPQIAPPLVPARESL